MSGFTIGKCDQSDFTWFKCRNISEEGKERTEKRFAAKVLVLSLHLYVHTLDVLKTNHSFSFFFNIFEKVQNTFQLLLGFDLFLLAASDT